MPSLPRIAVIGTGGTISSLGNGSLDVLDYPDFGEKLTPEDLLAKFPETRLVAEAVPVTFRQVGSTAIGPEDWLELRAMIHRIARDDPGVVGFVITHGTATLEETAFFLNLTVATDKPVVLVGAQRPASALGTDAGMNLVNALRLAGSPDARGKGVLVLLNDEIGAARDVVKTSTYRVQTFRSLDFGALGHVDGDGVHFYRAPLKSHAPDTPFAKREFAVLPRVDIVYSYAGADAALVEAAVKAGSKGIVSAGLRTRQPEPGTAEGAGRGGRSRDRRRAMHPRCQRPGRAAAAAARNGDRRRRGPVAAKGAHPLDADADHDNRHRRDPGGIPGVLTMAAITRRAFGAAAMTRRAFGAAALAAALVPRARAAEAGSTLRFVPHADLSIVDPYVSGVYITRNYGYLVFDTLFSLDADLKPQPQMVGSYIVSGDKLTWDFHLRDGLAFHDGQKVRGADVAASPEALGRAQRLVGPTAVGGRERDRGDRRRRVPDHAEDTLPGARRAWHAERADAVHPARTPRQDRPVHANQGGRRLRTVQIRRG